MLCNWIRMLRRARGAQLLLRIKSGEACSARSRLLTSPCSFPRRLIVGPDPVRCGLRPQLFLSRAGALPRKVRASLDQIRDRSFAPTHRLPHGSCSGSPDHSNLMIIILFRSISRICGKILAVIEMMRGICSIVINLSYLIAAYTLHVLQTVL